MYTAKQYLLIHRAMTFLVILCILTHICLISTGLDGKSVIVFGGGMPEDERTQMNDVFILELATMRWTAPSIKGVPPKPRRYHKGM